MSQTFDLHDVIQRYGDQPEVLGLILSSKVEEDRRKAEEARLRQKELEYLILQLLSPNKSAAGSPSEMTNHQFQTRDHLYSRRDSRTNTLPPINVSLQSHGRSAELPSSTSHRDESSESLQDERRSSAPNERYANNKQSSINFNQQRSISLDDNTSNARIHSSLGESSDSPKKLLLPPNNRPPKPSCPDMTNRPRRRRREMQAISMIIETREFPYNDEYVWKNNGNTIHKNTGQKSIYYKCSNSMMGCPVNKTVTFRENGEYLIKYRGNHLNDCNKIKRVVNI
ncbi:hypothetical protein FB192DRAFT_1419173 [Mucor lusitanicus]|uniref:WRKY domain-containing protein n=1 Tax=Mucor circinelloides f. lusitanicus TaxID=29924 RepID=A0A8H4BQ17_MUCCL|nr:hypothetical protein FB192DRAFT_1419173 [Mucor lusitanicus]